MMELQRDCWNEEKEDFRVFQAAMDRTVACLESLTNLLGRAMAAPAATHHRHSSISHQHQNAPSTSTTPSTNTAPSTRIAASDKPRRRIKVKKHFKCPAAVQLSKKLFLTSYIAKYHLGHC